MLFPRLKKRRNFPPQLPPPQVFASQTPCLLKIPGPAMEASGMYKCVGLGLKVVSFGCFEANA